MMFSLVSAMNVAFSNPKGNPEALDWKRISKQVANIKDEYNEAQHAIEKKSTDDYRDALCDIMVFALGAYHFMGIQYAPGGLEAALRNVKSDPKSVDWELLSIKLKYVLDMFNRAEAAADLLKCPRTLETELNGLMAYTLVAYDALGMDPEVDMKTVIDALYTRFCKDQAELEATLQKYKDLGVEVYVEGDFPTKCVKSAKDQKDKNGDNLPLGKFLKCAFFKTPVFAPIV